MGAVGNVQSSYRACMGNTQLVKNRVGRFSHGDLVHQVASNPESPTQIIVSFDNKYSVIVLREHLPSHESVWPRSRYQDIALYVFLELRGEFADYRPSHILLADLLK